MTGIVWTSDTDVARVPELAGVYVFRDAQGKALYVGKSTNLRARLRSYRDPGSDGRILIRFMDAHTVETIVTRNEKEALLLEDSLIKTHQPPHNIRLKDDKSFLMLRLDANERFPRLKFVRAHQPRQGASGRTRLFGPYASARSVRRTLADLHRVVPLRDCPDSVMNHRSRPCIKHQIGMCSAPCVGLIDAEHYALLVEKAAGILSGESSELERDLEARMRAASDVLDYERAADLRDRLDALRRTVSGQGVAPKDKVHRDVLGLARAGQDAVIHRLSFREGRLAESRAHHFKSQLADEELLHGAITALYASSGREIPAELVLPCEPAERELLESVLGRGLSIQVPRGGERARMLDLAFENARAELVRLDREHHAEEEALAELARLCDLREVPEVIDCFDISNLQGGAIVASRVRFKRGHADRAGYRRFKLRGVTSQDDFASMREVVTRSLKRGVGEEDLPDLVVIDGGAAQLASALEAREESAAWDVQMIALAKARSERSVKGKKRERSEERVFLPGAKEPLELARHSAARHLLERIRDEAHRFAITYHRKERGRIRSQLDAIPGVGDTRRKALLRRFGSVAGVREASLEEIASVAGIGRALALVIRERLHAPDQGA